MQILRSCFSLISAVARLSDLWVLLEGTLQCKPCIPQKIMKHVPEASSVAVKAGPMHGAHAFNYVCPQSPCGMFT